MYRTDCRRRDVRIGSLLKDSQQAIYSFICVKEHTGLVPGYQSIANNTKILMKLSFNLQIQPEDTIGIHRRSHIIAL